MLLLLYVIFHCLNKVEKKEKLYNLYNKNKSKIRTLLPKIGLKNGEINRFRVHKYSDSRTVPNRFAHFTKPLCRRYQTALHTVPKLVPLIW